MTHLCCDSVHVIFHVCGSDDASRKFQHVIFRSCCQRYSTGLCRRLQQDIFDLTCIFTYPRYYTAFDFVLGPVHNYCTLSHKI
jgi:hypothetical protein